MFSVTLSVNARFRECCPRILRGMLPYGVRTFLQRVPQTRDAPAIICHRRIEYHKKRNLEARKPLNLEAGTQERILRRRRFGVRWLDTALDCRATIPVFLTQNGGGTAIRKIMIIASAITSLARMAPMFPSKLP